MPQIEIVTTHESPPCQTHETRTKQENSGRFGNGIRRIDSKEPMGSCSTNPIAQDYTRIVDAERMRPTSPGERDIEEAEGATAKQIPVDQGGRWRTCVKSHDFSAIVDAARSERSWRHIGKGENEGAKTAATLHKEMLSRGVKIDPDDLAPVIDVDATGRCDTGKWDIERDEAATSVDKSVLSGGITIAADNLALLINPADTGGCGTGKWDIDTGELAARLHIPVASSGVTVTPHNCAAIGHSCDTHSEWYYTGKRQIERAKASTTVHKDMGARGIKIHSGDLAPVIDSGGNGSCSAREGNIEGSEGIFASCRDTGHIQIEACDQKRTYQSSSSGDSHVSTSFSRCWEGGVHTCKLVAITRQHQLLE